MGHPSAKKNEKSFDPYFTPYINMNSKWITDLEELKLDFFTGITGTIPVIMG